jgi:hypothetical protein
VITSTVQALQPDNVTATAGWEPDKLCEMLLVDGGQAAAFDVLQKLYIWLPQLTAPQGGRLSCC